MGALNLSNNIRGDNNKKKRVNNVGMGIIGILSIAGFYAIPLQGFMQYHCRVLCKVIALFYYNKKDYNDSL